MVSTLYTLFYTLLEGSSKMSLSFSVTAFLVTSRSSKQVSLMIFLSFVERKKSFGVRSGELDGCSTTVKFLLDADGVLSIVMMKQSQFDLLQLLSLLVYWVQQTSLDLLVD